MTPTKTAEQIFIADLRNVLYLMQIMRYSLDAFKSLECTPSFMKTGSQNIMNGINRFISDCMVRVSPETWESVQRELNKDELYDVGLLLDFASHVSNVGEIVEVLNEHLNVEIDGNNNN